MQWSASIGATGDQVLEGADNPQSLCRPSPLASAQTSWVRTQKQAEHVRNWLFQRPKSQLSRSLSPAASPDQEVNGE